MNTVYLGIGTNLGDKIKNLESALSHLNNFTKVLSVSSIYETPAFGFESNELFFNIVIKCKTNFSASELLRKTQETEKEMGRILYNDNQYHNRVIDIDILLYNDSVIQEKNLKIPHPEIVNRNFVLLPLIEIEAKISSPKHPNLCYADLLTKNMFNRITKKDKLNLKLT